MDSPDSDGHVEEESFEHFTSRFKLTPYCLDAYVHLADLIHVSQEGAGYFPANYRYTRMLC